MNTNSAPDALAKRLLVVFVTLALAFGIAALLYLRSKSGEAAAAGFGGELKPLDNYGAAPKFEGVDQSGTATTQRDYQGKVWIAGFFFSRCAGVCPKLMQNWRYLQEQLGDSTDFGIASFTVDPEYDTPKVLADFGSKYSVRHPVWRLIHMDRADVVALSRNGFRLGTSEVPEEFVHSDRFVLIDRENKIRGYYRGTDKDDIARLATDAKTLIETPGR